MQSEHTLLVSGPQRTSQQLTYWLLAGVIIAAVFAASLLNFEVTPGVLIDDILLLIGGTIAGFLLVFGNHSLPRIHWAGFLLLGAASLATLWGVVVDGGIHLDSIHSIVSVWWLRIAIIGSVALMIAVHPRLINVVCAAAFYCILITAMLVIALSVASGEDAVLRQPIVLHKTLPEALIGASSLSRANSIMRGVVILLPLAIWHARNRAWWLALLLMLAGIIIALTRSRTGLVVFSLEAIVAFFCIVGGLAIRVAVGIALLAAIPIVVTQVSHRLAVIARTQEGASGPRVREVLFDSVLQLISERPAEGWGIGNASESINQMPSVVLARKMHTGHEHLAIHNNFMLYAIESGVATAALAFMFFVSLIFAAIIAAFQRPPHLRTWFILLSLSGIASLAVMQTATVLRENVLWIVVGIMLTSLVGVGLPQRSLKLQSVIFNTRSVSGEEMS